MVEMYLNLYMFNLNKNFSMDKVENIEFYSDGTVDRVILRKQSSPTTMYEIASDGNLRQWSWANKEERREITTMNQQRSKLPDEEILWRKLDKNNDKSIIKEFIAKLKTQLNSNQIALLEEYDQINLTNL